jgi:hypothetical protein
LLVPAGFLSFDPDTLLGGLLLEQIEREVLHHGEVFRPVTDHHPRSVLTEDDIEGPVDDILDLPVEANRFTEGAGRAVEAVGDAERGADHARPAGDAHGHVAAGRCRRPARERCLAPFHPGVL